mgnify:CR=1 FL=1
MSVSHSTNRPVYEGAPPAVERSPRARVAAVLALHALGGLDAGSPDYRWFGPQLGWEAEHDCARRVALAARGAADLPDWLPPPAWFAAEAAAYTTAAGRWRRQAEVYRERIPWEIDREESLHAWARHFDAVADAHAEHACRLARWAGGSW